MRINSTHLCCHDKRWDYVWGWMQEFNFIWASDWSILTQLNLFQIEHSPQCDELHFDWLIVLLLTHHCCLAWATKKLSKLLVSGLDGAKRGENEIKNIT